MAGRLVTKDLMPRDISAVLRHGGGSGSAQHCTAMTNYSNTIQCLGSDDIMSLGIKSSAFLRMEDPS